MPDNVFPLRPPPPGGPPDDPLLPALAARWRFAPISAAIWKSLAMDTEAVQKVLANPKASKLDVGAARLADMFAAGNLKAAHMVLERIEGRVGVRPGEVPAEDDGEKSRRQSVIEEVVVALVSARLARGDDAAPGDGTQVIEGEATTAPAATPPASVSPPPACQSGHASDPPLVDQSAEGLASAPAAPPDDNDVLDGTNLRLGGSRSWAPFWAL